MPSSGPTGPRASFGRRLAAWLLDGLIVGVPFTVAFVVTAGAGPSNANGDPSGWSIPAIIIELTGPWVVGFFYHAFLDGSRSGQTIGKRAAGIRVVDQRTGQSIGLGRGFGRAGGMLLANILVSFCFLGFLDYLWMLWDTEKQTIHDKMVGSYVVPEWAYPKQPPYVP